MLFKHHRHHHTGVESTESAQELPLSHLPVGVPAQVTQVLGGHGLANRIACLGFTPGADVTLLQNFGHGPLIAGNWLWNAYRYGFDAFGAAVRYEGRILGMDGFVVVPAALAAPSLHHALWELERLELDEAGTAGTFPLEKPTLADGRDASAGTAYRPAHLLGKGAPLPLPAPIRPAPSLDGLLRLTDRHALRAYVHHDPTDVAPNLPNLSFLEVRVVLALWPTGEDPVLP